MAMLGATDGSVSNIRTLYEEAQVVVLSGEGFFVLGSETSPP